MKRHRQLGFFDIGERTTLLGQRGDPLAGLKARIHWEAFRSGFNRVLDSKTVWLFQERLKHLNRVQVLFDRFHPQLAEQGYAARTGQRTSAAFVEVLRQRNSREDNSWIKTDETPVPCTQDAAKPMLRQKDLDARWTRKHKENPAACPNEGRGLQEPHQRRSSAPAGAALPGDGRFSPRQPGLRRVTESTHGAGRHKRSIYAGWRPDAQPNLWGRRTQPSIDGGAEGFKP